MDNQHRKINGYRELDEEEIFVMNAIKEKAKEVGDLINSLRITDAIDQRWIAIAETDLQKGFMALVRAVAKPESF